MSTSSTDMRSEMNEPHSIPRNVHFIWVGGPIPEKYLKTVLQVTQHLEKMDLGFEVNLWVDNKDNLIKPLQKLLTLSEIEEHQGKYSGIRLKMVSELEEIINTHEVFKEDNNRRDMHCMLGREAIGSKNLAALADLMRYIFLLEGGYYFDVDTVFKRSKVFVDVNEQPPYGIYLNFRISMNPDLMISGGNDIIGAIPNHPIILSAIRNCIQRYKELDERHYNEHDEQILAMVGIKYLAGKSGTTSMDAKRYPRNPNTTNHLVLQALNPHCRKMGLSIQASGPGALADATIKFITDRKLPDPEFLGCYKQTSEHPSGIPCLLDLKLFSRSDLNWLDKTPPPVVSHDDTKLPPHTFFGSTQSTQDGDEANTSGNLKGPKS